MAKGCLLCCYDATLVVAVFWCLAAIAAFAAGVSAYAFYQVIVAFWVFMVISLALSVGGYLMSRRRLRWRDNSKRIKGWRAITEPPVVQYIYIVLTGVVILFFLASVVWITQSEHQPLLDLKILNRGQLSHNSATFLIRNSERTSVVMQYRITGSQLWQVTEDYDLTEARDFLAGITLENLTPETDYEFQVIFDDEDEMSQIESFRTRPVPDPNSDYAFKFGFGSCIYKQNEPLLNIRDMAAEEPDFNLFLGDFIYWDHPFPLSSRTSFYHYRYRSVYNDEYIRQLLAYPSYFMLDDHEIDNDWDQGTAGRYFDAIAAWNDYCGVNNPKINATAPEDITLYYSFDIGSTSFFIMDTRTFRTPNREPSNSETKTMLGAEQLQDLFDWLVSHNSSQIKFIGTSVPFTEVSRGSDVWAGRVVERQKILDFIVRNNINGVVFLSGDRHWAGAFKLRKGIYEFSVSPLNGFFSPSGPRPFAGSSEELLWGGGGTNFYGMMKVDPTSDNIITTSITPQGEDAVTFTITKEDLLLN
jgi:alkaline phosphatase D